MKDQEDGKFLVGEEEGKQVIVARAFDIYWFVAAGPLNNAKQDKGFKDYNAAYDAIMTIWQPIADNQKWRDALVSELCFAQDICRLFANQRNESHVAVLCVLMINVDVSFEPILLSIHSFLFVSIINIMLSVQG